MAQSIYRIPCTVPPPLTRRLARTDSHCMSGIKRIQFPWSIKKYYVRPSPKADILHCWCFPNKYTSNIHCIHDARRWKATKKQWWSVYVFHIFGHHLRQYFFRSKYKCAINNVQLLKTGMHSLQPHPFDSCIPAVRYCNARAFHELQTNLLY